MVVPLAHRVERAELGGLDAAEHRIEIRLAHHRQDVGAGGDVERRLAGEPDRVAARFLPGDQMRQQLARRLLVADEIVVDKIHRAANAGVDHRVELGDDLLGLLVARLAAVKRRDVAEFAAIGAAARILDVAEEIAPSLDQPVGGDREIAERQALVGGQHALRRRRVRIGVERGDQRVGGVADLADMEVIEFGIMLRAGRDRRPAERADLAGGVGAAADPDDALALDMHPADKHRIGPGEIRRRGLAHVFVDEPHFPRRRQIGGNDEQALRRHERPHPIHQRIGILERAERRRIAREDAKDAPDVTHGHLASHSPDCPYLVFAATRFYARRRGYVPHAARRTV